MRNRETGMTAENQEARGGWLRLYRKLKDHPRYRQPGFVAVWVHILLSANFKAKRERFNGKVVTVLPGQFISSRRLIAASTGVHVATVGRMLEALRSDQQLDQQAGVKSSMFTVLNWASYQKDDPQSDPQNDPQLIHNRSTTDPQLIHKIVKPQAGVDKNAPKKERRKEGKKPRSRSGGKGDARGGLPEGEPRTNGVLHFEPVRKGLFVPEYKELIAVAEREIERLRSDPANVVRSEHELTTQAAEDMAWIAKEKLNRPEDAEKLDAEAKRLTTNPNSFRILGLNDETKAKLKAWRARIAEIESVMMGVTAA